jgi:hypothetical protein
MIPENRLDEIALLPSRRENVESNDVQANYLVGRDMAGAIHELLEERHELLLQVDEMRKVLEFCKGVMEQGHGEECSCIQKINAVLTTTEKRNDA